MADVLPSDELANEPSEFGALRPGTRLGRYELLVPVARGGMARVWAARLHGQRGFQKLVAIKTILPHLAEESDFERMFLDEARIASRVQHPNVCEIYELGEEQQTLYMAMEWVNGDSLARVLRASGKTEAIDPRVAARVIADACAGVHAAHELTDDDGRKLGVVHRDLSPHNILLTADGTAKVVDFGVAKALGQLHETTTAGQLKGKIAYMAPEQITGGAVDRRSDVFSLGCVLYEATTGQRPFRGDGDHQVMHSVLKGEFPAPSSLLRGYPQELERIVQRALSPQPILRFPTAERMRFALEELLTRGQLVTQSNVAQVIRARIGDLIERRKEKIKQASTTGDREGGWSEPPGASFTPSNRAHDPHRSGVKPSAPHPARLRCDTVQMDRPVEPAPPSAPYSAPPPTPLLGGGGGAGAGAQGWSGGGTLHGVPAPPPVGAQPLSSATIPQAPLRNHPSYSSLPAVQPADLAGASYAHAVRPSPQTAALQPFAASSVPSPNDSNAPASTAFSSAPPSVSVPLHASARAAAPVAPPDAPPPAPAHETQHPSTPPAGPAQYALAVGAGILLAAMIGGGGLYAWRARHPRSAPEPSTSTPIVAVASTTVPVTNAPSTDILFDVTPADATLSVDGADLPPGTRAVPRPSLGKTATVVVRAKDHDDVTVQVDFFTTSPMVLSLEAATTVSPTPTAIATSPSTRASRADAAAQSTQPSERPAPKPKPQQKGDSLPANPY